jgi:surface antigen
MAALVVGCLTAYAPAAVDAAGHSCQCVEYVKSYFGLKGAAGDAKDMAPFLAAHGFHRISAPIPGAVVIIQPRFYSSGPAAVYGHVAIVKSVTASGTSSWKLDIRGGNQSGKEFTASGCSNVTEKTIGPISRTSQAASYWAPPRR